MIDLNRISYLKIVTFYENYESDNGLIETVYSLT